MCVSFAFEGSFIPRGLNESFRPSGGCLTGGVSVRTNVERRERRLHGQVNAFLLIFCLLLPFAQFAFSSPVNTGGLPPVCCRTHGRHKCLLRNSGLASSSHSPQFVQVTERCPCTPGLVPSGHRSSLWAPVDGSAPFRLRNQHSVAAGSGFECAPSPALANCKRGPPNFSVSA